MIERFPGSVPEEQDEAMKPKEAPVFVSLPEPVTVEEGEWARFCVRVTGHPRPRVMWLINGHTVVNVSTAWTKDLSQCCNAHLISGFPLQADIRWHVPHGYSKDASVRHRQNRSHRAKFHWRSSGNHGIECDSKKG